MDTSPSESRGEVGGTGSDPYSSSSSSSHIFHTCDACEGCDDVCGLKSCPRCSAKRARMALDGPACPCGYTRCQVARHDKAGDCWLIAHSRVYDATKFMTVHPAGPEPILSRAGKDVSVDYDFHSSLAQRRYWKPLCIGRLVKCPLRDRGTISDFPCTIQ